MVILLWVACDGGGPRERPSVGEPDDTAHVDIADTADLGDTSGRLADFDGDGIDDVRAALLGFAYDAPELSGH